MLCLHPRTDPEADSGEGGVEMGWKTLDEKKVDGMYIFFVEFFSQDNKFSFGFENYLS